MINWFPGHMVKTLRELQVKSRLANLFIYVLDARCPLSCINPEFVKIIKGKPIIYVLNKADLADGEYTREIIKKLTDENNQTIAISLDATKSNTGKTIISLINKLMQNKIKQNNENNVKFVFRAMVIGVPNSGKSTLVNNLIGKNVKAVGNKAGVTKSTSWATINTYLEVMDTPGTLYPKISSDNIGYNLAFVGSINDDILDVYDIALNLVSRLIESKYKGNFERKYGLLVDEFKDLEIEDENGELKNFSRQRQMIEKIAQSRGAIARGGEIDYERVAKLILTDFRSGAIGKISFD